MKLLEFLDVSLAYDGILAVEKISFTVRAGDFIYITGENGSGKSTLVKAIAGLIKPVCGKIIFSDRLKNGKVGYLPQQIGDKSDFPAVVREVVLSGCASKNGIFPLYKRLLVEKAEDIMCSLGIDKLCDRPFSQLSGGQRQRVLLARALCVSDSFLLLDEPSAGLDCEIRRDLQMLIGKLNSKGVTVCMVTHEFSDIIENGKVLHLGDKNCFFGSATEYNILYERGAG